MGTRRDRVSDLIKDEISRLLLREIHDPRIGFVTITGATVSSDLRSARVYVSVLGDGERRQDALDALNNASGFMRRTLFKNLRLKFSLSLVFVLDESLDHGERIDRILDSIRSDGESSGTDEEEG